MRKKLIKQGLWYFLFSSLSLLLIATRYFKYFSHTNEYPALLYLTLATVSHFISLSISGFLIYLPIILIIPKRDVAWISAGIITTISAILLLLDTCIFDLYRIHLNRFTLELLVGGAASQIFSFHHNQYILSVLTTLAVLAIMLWGAYKFFHWKKVHTFRKGMWVTIIIALMTLTTHFTHAWADAVNYIPITKSSRYYPLFFPTTNKALMVKLGVADEATSQKYNLQFSKTHNALQYPRQPLLFADTCKTNIILLLIDSWYYPALDSAVMPNIYRFSKKCSTYNRHYSGSNGTRTGVFSLFYSIAGTYWDAVLSTQTSPVFMDVLQKNQYRINTFPSATLRNPPFHRTIFSKIENLRLDTHGNSPCDRDMQITTNWLEERSANRENQQPFFDFLFYDALHAIQHPKTYTGPFQPAWSYPKYELLQNNLDPTPFLNLYKNSAHFVDSLAGVVIQHLESTGLLEKSWVIITGDHGQEFNDNKKNYWGHNGNYSAAQMQVPLLIRRPDKKAQTFTHWTSHYDIVPTLMSDLFHCKNPIADYSIGKHLNDTLQRDWLLVGSPDNYAILEPNSITSIYFNGTFDITDPQLNPLPQETFNSELIHHILSISNSFYREP